MIADFIYYNPVKVYFGQIGNLSTELEKYGKKVLLIYGSNSIKQNGIYDEIKNLLNDFSVFELDHIEPNPDVTSVRKGSEICKKENINVVLAVGGGSVIDASKWIAASACVEYDAWDFFEKKTKIDNALPLVTIPTMAATGSDMNCGGVISNREKMKKIGRSSPYLFPKASFLIPEFTYSVSNYQTACGVADILSHVLEVYFTNQESLEMLYYIMEGIIKTVMKYGVIALEKPKDYEARANLLWSASWAINGFINGPIRQGWNCHTIEHELSARFGITHGHGLAIILPRWMKYCYSQNNSAVYKRLAKNIFSIDNFSLDVFCKKIEDFLYNQLGLKAKLSELNIAKEDLNKIAHDLCAGKNILGFADLSETDVCNILKMCY